ncbi:bifunctional glycosyltransferase family 2/GtrA family protein [Gordonia sp. ABSL1-1]|uniref:bifunctional glycosyltransferase family 2/GtrA family protein n=1 Tax=Gordonia sp. ABSL1-1 TaxID=3053923 RepID=UPI0025742A15|nr:bifunctional glycosyltransferase family 2/GtrA family protein [Gordonia sp. ABSL1-1]MDL9936884.1 bifunctional glycosyltransferase family 2/GtrA family protein [Gordonia sp. ABSL1-1]
MTTDVSQTLATTPTTLADSSVPRPVLDIVVPVYNEQADIADSVRRLHAHLRTHVPYAARITVADNASTDDTLAIATELATEIDGLRVMHLDEKGRGRALNAVWRRSDAEIVAYCDVDLSTDLNALMPLIAPLISRHSDIAIGTRLSRSSRVVRGAKREFISRSYNLILRTTMGAKFSDAQCGFKAMRTDIARELLPYVEDTGWFFDTELLVLAERIGLRIAEIPVDWVDDPDSTVDIVATAVADLKGCARVGFALATGRLPIVELRAAIGRDRAPGPAIEGVPPGLVGQLARFCVVGVASTLAYAVLYLMLHSVLGAQVSNFVALAITAVLNTAANRRFSFGVRGRADAVRHHLFGLGVFVFGWLVTAGSLAMLHILVADTSKQLELLVLIVANLVATITRFVGLRWIFRPQLDAADAAA